MMKICDHELCTGCSACASTCPKHCVILFVKYSGNTCVSKMRCRIVWAVGRPERIYEK